MQRNFFCIFGFILVYSFIDVCLTQHVFKKIKTCRYETKRSQVIFEDSVISFRNQNQEFFLSLCSTSLKETCNNEVSACSLNKLHPEESINNLGEYFVYEKIQKDEILKSVNGQFCKQEPNKRNTIVIHLKCEEFLKAGPMFMSQAKCEYHILLLHPTCSLKCTTRIGKDNYLLDLETFENIGDTHITSGNRSFYTSLCGPAERCNQLGETQYMACEINTDGIIPIADVETQHLNYHSGVHSIRGRTGPKSGRKYTELFLSCNWEATDRILGSMRITQGNHYNFQLQSRQFCFMFPTDLMAKKDHYLYNITSLCNGNKSHQWRVNGAVSSIYLNICGPLLNNIGRCREQHAQVCLYQTGKETINLGSIANDFEITDKDTVKLSYKDGSRCTSNQTYNTEIEFVCSQLEQGPKLVSWENCKYVILWNTPAACPAYSLEGQNNCIIIDSSGYRRNLSGIHTANDRIISIDRVTSFRFNLCGDLTEPCAGVKVGVSACLQQNGKEIVVGWSNKLLSNFNGNLVLRLDDPQANRVLKKKFSTVVYFQCSYSSGTEGTVSLQYSNDLTEFSVFVNTSLACNQYNLVDCSLEKNGLKFDLSPLISNDSNYIVHGVSEDYIINVCRPIVNGNGELCPFGSPVCLKQHSELHLMRKYKRLGSVASPEWENNEIVIRNRNGGYCRESSTFDTSSVIHFRCSQQEQQPQILKKDNCSAEFTWYTKHACPCRLANCQFNISSNVIDLSIMKEKVFTFKKSNKTLTLNVCSTNYTLCKTEDDCSNVQTKREVLTENNISYISFKINDNEMSIKEVRFELACNTTETNHQSNEINEVGNILYLKLMVLTGCQITPKQTIRETPVFTSHEEEKLQILPQKYIEEKETASKSKVVITKCSIQSPSTNAKLSLDSLLPWSVLSRSANYSINLGSIDSTCGGHICKNATSVTSKLQNCPFLFFNSTSVRLNYTGFKLCNGEDFKSAVTLKCKNDNEIPFVTFESYCSVEIIYPIKEACKLFSRTSNPTSSTERGLSIGAIIGISISVLFVIISGIFITVKWNKIRRDNNYSSFERRSNFLLQKVKCLGRNMDQENLGYFFSLVAQLIIISLLELARNPLPNSVK